MTVVEEDMLHVCNVSVKSKANINSNRLVLALRTSYLILSSFFSWRRFVHSYAEVYRELSFTYRHT